MEEKRENFSFFYLMAVSYPEGVCVVLVFLCLHFNFLVYL